MERRDPSSSTLAELIRRLQSRLDERASARTKAWWEAYLKNVIAFRGVKMDDIRSALHAWFKDERLGDVLSAAQQKDLALALLEEQVAEDKLAGILFLQEILLPAGLMDWRTDLPRFARLFSDGHIFDWSTCDWFCVRVLGPLVRREGEACARAISEWRNADDLWQRRASVVAFVNLAKAGDANFPGFTDMLLENCAALVQSQERFAQTGTGWVLRELGRADQERVIRFVEMYAEHFSREGLTYAIEKMPSEVKRRLIQVHGERITKNRAGQR